MIIAQDIFPASDKPANRLLTVFLALVAFTLPFKFLVNVFIALAFVTWLFTKPSFAQPRSYRNILFVVLGFYLLHAIAFLYTDNIQEGFFNLEIRLGLLFFPLIFFTSVFPWPKIKLFLTAFILGNLLCCVVCMLRAFYLTCTEGKSYFFYQDLSWFQHPSYLSMYLTFCCVVLLQKNIFTTVQNLLAIFFFTAFVLLLSSKTGIAIHFLFLLMVGISHFLLRKKLLALMLFIVSGILVLVSAISFIPPVKERFNNVVAAFSAGTVDKSATESTAVRMLIWQEAKGLIAEHPLFGVGPGDANDELYKSYVQHGLSGAYSKKLNAHSQFFQTTVGLGLLGFASLLAVFLSPLFYHRRKLLVFFLLITAVNFLTESMLQTMAGSIFFSYFYAMLAFDRQIESAHQNSKT